MGKASIDGRRIARGLGGIGLAAGFALGAVACADDTETAEAALTRDEFIEQADAICQRVNDEAEPHFEATWASLEGIDEESEEGQDVVFAAFDDLLETVGPMWRTMADEIGALAPPTEDRELIDTLVQDLQAAIDEMDRTIDAAVGGDEEARRALDDTDPMEDVNRRAQAYGMAVCGADG